MPYLSNINIYCDSNQKAGKHKTKEKYFVRNGYNIIKKRLKVGDYMLDINGKISVDTKQDLNEVYSNLFNVDDNKRFIRECLRAKHNKIKLVILIEESLDINNLPNILIGNSQRNFVVRGSHIRDRMLYFEKLYGIKFMFCEPDRTGAEIIDILSNYDKSTTTNNLA